MSGGGTVGLRPKAHTISRRTCLDASYTSAKIHLGAYMQLTSNSHSRKPNAALSTLHLGAVGS
eukprot:14979868-Alexandrium_andersonii.AAC.1